MRIAVSDLPDVSKNRLLRAITQSPADTFVFHKSRSTWAAVGLVFAVLSVGLSMSAANGFRWNQDERTGIFLLILASLLVGSFSCTYLAALHRSALKDVTLVNPLYLLRVRPGHIDVYHLLSTKDFKATHGYNQQGQYTGTTLAFVFEDGQETLKITSLPHAKEFLSALQRFPNQVADVLRRGDSDAMYQLDLLYEWRMRENQYPRTGANKGRSIARKYALPATIGTVLATGLFYGADRANDYYDDEKRWHDAAGKNTATAYRVYLAARPSGRHYVDTQSAIARLYERAASDYQAITGFEESPGVEAVIAMLTYAQRTGRYKVYVKFEDDTQIPSDIESRLRRLWGVSNIVPVQPSFTPSANSTRQAGITQRITTTFGQVIPGDILQFSPGQGTSRDVNFQVFYTVKASGHLYYPESQKHLPMARRDLYTGISFDWFFEVYVPGLEAELFQFSLTSEPADLFRVAYTRYSTEDRSLSAGQVYDAMADSAFDNFAARLFSEVSLPSSP